MHLISETALDLIDGTMAQAERRFWTNHLESCSQCAVELNDWAELTQWVKGSHLIDAPEQVQTLAMGIIKPRKTLETRRPLQQILATVVFDSFAQPAWASVRGRTVEQTVSDEPLCRELVLAAVEFDIHVRISTSEQRRQLLGQILPRDNKTFFVENAKLHLRQRDERIGCATMNDLGEFWFTDIPDGSLSLQIDLPHRIIICALGM